MDFLLAALATDLLSGLEEESRRDGDVPADVELRLEAFLENPLVVAGVIGEEGSPRLTAIRGSLFLSGVRDEAGIRASWQHARERSPVLASLASDLTIDIALKLVH